MSVCLNCGSGWYGRMKFEPCQCPLPLSPPEEERPDNDPEAWLTKRLIAYERTIAGRGGLTKDKSKAPRRKALVEDILGSITGMDENDVAQVLCRVFEPEEYDAIHEEWQAWYKPEQWFHRSRAFGAFLGTKLMAIIAERDAARSALKDSFDRAYDLACLLNVDRPSESGRAQPMRFTEREIL